MNDRNNDERKIDALVNHPETRTVEFKAARETFSRDEAINYCVAIANEGGGELVLGITDKLPRQICGSNAIPDLRGSGVDRALEAIETLVQRAPEFVLHDAATSVILRGQLDVSQMTDDEKVRTVYLHCCLRYEQRQSLTNTSLRQRVNLPTSKTWLASNMISATVEAGLIKPDPRAGTSRKYAAYLPFFAG